MGKLIIMDVTFNLMSRINPPYMAGILQKVNTENKIKSILKEGQPTMYYIEIEEDEIDWEMFK